MAEPSLKPSSVFMSIDNPAPIPGIRRWLPGAVTGCPFPGLGPRFCLVTSYSVDIGMAIGLRRFAMGMRRGERPAFPVRRGPGMREWISSDDGGDQNVIQSYCEQGKVHW
jgi:hypothetical protein